ADADRVAVDDRRPGDDELPCFAQAHEVAVVVGDDAALLFRRRERHLRAHRPQHDEEAHAGKTTSARLPRRPKSPCSSSSTSARTIESPVPGGASPAPPPSSAIASTTSPFR